jgi:hypothetical protein
LRSLFATVAGTALQLHSSVLRKVGMPVEPSLEIFGVRELRLSHP